MIAILNAHMFGADPAPGERVDWSEPDVMPAADWRALLGESVEDYAANNPHMIVSEVEL